MNKYLLMLAIAIASFSCSKADESDMDSDEPADAGFEIWMGQKTGSTGNWSNLRWMVVLPDGRFFNQLPTEGFLNFNANQTGGTWGTFTMNGINGVFTNPYETLNVKKISAAEMEIAGYANHLYKLASVDGVKLSGKYVNGIPGWSTSGSYPYSGNDAQPMIEFTADGGFVDKGAFVLNFTMPYQYPERAPGKGLYEIKNFTLTLNYEDGRKVTKAFSGVLNNKVTVTTELVLVGGNPFYSK
ncbi:hypothetical protein ABDK00_000800 [Niabella insulamsoli]|uniref:hypothetical protein n=1 Tax=Niabella insulamsoli TaxID=3144874 RepID=UPI0031FDFC9B